MDRKFAFFAFSFSIVLLLLQTVSGFWLATGISAVACAGFSAFLFIKGRKAQGIYLLCGFVFAILLFFIYPKFDTVPELYKDDMSFKATVTGYSYETNNKTGIACDVDVTVLNDEELDSSFTVKMFFKDKNLELSPGDEISGLAFFSKYQKTTRILASIRITKHVVLTLLVFATILFTVI